MWKMPSSRMAGETPYVEDRLPMKVILRVEGRQEVGATAVVRPHEQRRAFVRACGPGELHQGVPDVFGHPAVGPVQNTQRLIGGCH